MSNGPTFPLWEKNAFECPWSWFHWNVVDIQMASANYKYKGLFTPRKKKKKVQSSHVIFSKREMNSK